MGWHKGREWTTEQDDYLKANYYQMSATQISKNLPGPIARSRNAVVGRANRLGMEKKSEHQNFTRQPPRPVRVATPQHVPPDTSYVGQKMVRMALVRTAQNEKGYFKLAPEQEVTLDLPNIWCEPVDLVDLRKYHCRWPLDGGKYCGLRRWESNPYGETPYCRGHHAAAHKAPAEHQRLTAKR